MKRGKVLSAGLVIGLVAPGSPPADPALVDQGVAALKAMGFEVLVGDSVRVRRGFLAGSDAERAADLEAMFVDSRVHAVLALRGGYGCARLLPLLHWGRIARHPKPLIGLSDVTVLHAAFQSKLRFASIHGSMAQQLSDPTAPPWTRESLVRLLTHRAPFGSIRAGYGGPVQTLVGGRATGVLVGGNLAALCSLIGTPYEPSWRGRILMFEEIGEPPFRLDRALTFLRQTGVLRKLAGVAIGLCEGCHDRHRNTLGEWRQTMEDVFRERLADLGIPVVMGLPFGHGVANVSVPLGVRATLDGDAADLIIEESVVR